MDGPDRVNARLRRLPAVDRLVDSAGTGPPLARWSLLAAARAVLTQARQQIQAGEAQVETSLEILAGLTRARAMQLERPYPRRVLNATGVVLHTNLGRAPLAPEASAALLEAATGYSDLELDLDTGARGSRLSRIGELLCEVSGAEAAMVVNNNAAAVFLAMDALAADREVVLSRGELVEIGGSFRVPEILAASRARLVEVGTTNRTHLRDYEAATGPQTGLLLKVHRSNFELRGFTKEVSLRELAGLAQERGVPLVEDRGSGTFVDLRAYGIPEPEVHDGLAQGADLVLFSGDKLLGGPQAGIVLGRAELVERMKRSPLARAVRVDKMTLAALHWTLRVILAGEAEARIPVLQMLTASQEALQAAAERLAKGIAERMPGAVSVEAEASLVGGGALPDIEIPGFVVRVDLAAGGTTADQLARRLRSADPPVLARIQRDALLLDPRTLRDDEIDATIRVFAELPEFDSSS
jgi:L-seryl-tRNA(Ser) seleniumtransferase